MKHFPKIGTVLTDIGRLRPYEPISSLLWLTVSGRAPKLTVGRNRVALFFRRGRSSVNRYNSFVQRVELKSSFMAVLNFSNSQHRRVGGGKRNFFTLSVGDKEERERGTSLLETGLFHLRALSVKDGFQALHKRSSVELDVDKKLSHRDEIEKRVFFLQSRRLVTERAEFRINRVDNEESGNLKVEEKRYPKPIVLFYGTGSALSAEAAPPNTQMQSLVKREKELIEKREKHLQSETKEILREKRKEIEVISEKVYSLVMRKWEQERRRRGALYD